MAHLKAAIKDIRRRKRHVVRNEATRSHVDNLRRLAKKALEGKDSAKAKELSSKIVKALDKALQHGIMKKNTVARYKSRLAKKVNVLAK